MALDPRTPVLVGVGAVAQRLDDFREGVDPAELMALSLERAAADAGSAQLLAQASSLRVPRGFWRYLDPGRLIAERIGANDVRTTLAEIGILQQTLLADACRAIVEGREEIALITGGEAKYRSLRARIAGEELGERPQYDVRPDELKEPAEPLFSDLEAERGLVMPVRAFALMENALRFADGDDLATHADKVAGLWAGLGEVARDNPDAWHREPVTMEEVRDEAGDNRMMSFPYRKRHNSDWNVDQAAGLILCSVEKAWELGLAPDGWIFPLASTESNHVVPLAARTELHRSPGARVAGLKALELADTTPARVEHLEVYSCFPAPVRVTVRELDLPADKPLTVTGGMAFAGGPLNNYVLQATVRMAQVLREDRGAKGLVTSISGFHNKQGFGVWSTEPPPAGFRFADCTAQVAGLDEARELELDAEYVGPASVVSYTVVYLGEAAVEGVVVCDLPNGRRTVAYTTDADLMDAMTRAEFCGASVDVASGGVFTRA